MFYFFVRISYTIVKRSFIVVAIDGYTQEKNVMFSV